MKIALKILLLSVFLCGCSQGHNTSPNSTLDWLQAGKDISLGNYVLHVQKREGSALEGIRMEKREADGQVTKITAERGKLLQGSDPSFFRIVLYDAHAEAGKHKSITTELILNLPTIGL